MLRKSKLRQKNGFLIKKRLVIELLKIYYPKVFFVVQKFNSIVQKHLPKQEMN